MVVQKYIKVQFYDALKSGKVFFARESQVLRSDKEK